MSKQHNPIHPVERYNDHDFTGLTKREYFAAMAMQGLLSNPGLHSHDKYDLNGCIQASLDAADELLKQLGK
jgi:hypothetical protein